jgi:hypothetical protein
MGTSTSSERQASEIGSVAFLANSGPNGDVVSRCSLDRGIKGVRGIISGIPVLVLGRGKHGMYPTTICPRAVKLGQTVVVTASTGFALLLNDKDRHSIKRLLYEYAHSCSCSCSMLLLHAPTLVFSSFNRPSL